MRASRWLILLIALILPAMARAQSPDLAAIRAEVESVNRAMEAAFNRGDMLAVARFYADDAAIMGPRMRVRGRENLDRYWQGITNPKSWRLDVFEVGGSRDEPWQVGRSTLVSLGAGGEEHTSVVDFIVLWRRQADGRLRIHVDMYPGGN
jgi:ketosteroid isomerase-like protein